MFHDLQLRNLRRVGRRVIGFWTAAAGPESDDPAVCRCSQWRLICPSASVWPSAALKNQSGWLRVMPVTLKKRTTARLNIDR